MNKTKKAMFIAGGMVALGALTYCMLPKENKKAIKDTVDTMSSTMASKVKNNM